LKVYNNPFDGQRGNNTGGDCQWALSQRALQIWLKISKRTDRQTPGEVNSSDVDVFHWVISNVTNVIIRSFTLNAIFVGGEVGKSQTLCLECCLEKAQAGIRQSWAEYIST
jgi:hypothetical protein